jgi:gamma-glutamylcyclotransferase (GGCT)/AIG2-like uncharacterized protein YtfP
MSEHSYFAYGSNLNQADLTAWAKRKGRPVPNLQFHCRAFLPDQKLVFPRYSKGREGGVLGFSDCPGSVVPGVVFRVDSPEDWRTLDIKENAVENAEPRGRKSSYQRLTTEVISEAGEIINVQTYNAHPSPDCDHFKPSDSYVDIVRTGLQASSLDTGPLETAASGTAPMLVKGFFFYGTFVRGESRFAVLKEFGVECCLLAETEGRLLDLGSYPGMVPPIAQGDWVKGEFLRLKDPARAIQALDRIEGFLGYNQSGSLYRRTLIYAHVGDGRFRPAWTYQLANAHAGHPVIASGDWRSHTNVRENIIRAIVQKHCGGDRAAVLTRLREITQLDPLGSEEVGLMDEEVLLQVLLLGKLSERRLAQASGLWNVDVGETRS